MKKVIDEDYLTKQTLWSHETFGPGVRTAGVIDHIKKELQEVEEDDTGMEWVDVIILAFDGAMRQGVTPQELIDGIHEKQRINMLRQWPDWRTFPPDVAIEHNRQEIPATLLDACLVVVSDEEVTRRYPEGVSGGDVLREIRARYGNDAFPLVSVLDVVDEMRNLFGPGKCDCDD